MNLKILMLFPEEIILYVRWSHTTSPPKCNLWINCIIPIKCDERADVSTVWTFCQEGKPGSGMRPLFSAISFHIRVSTKGSSIRNPPLNLHLVWQRELINLGTNTHRKSGIINSFPHKIIIFLCMIVSQACCENAVSHRDLPHAQKIIMLCGREHQWIL